SSTTPRSLTPTPFPYTTLFRSLRAVPIKDHGILSPVRTGYAQHGRRGYRRAGGMIRLKQSSDRAAGLADDLKHLDVGVRGFKRRSEEHTSELQSPDHLVCRLLL